jgi:aspartyl-tRNA(Asn)/glutamyl-tRNA(Gln) amidotransferase subunit A
MNDPCSGSATAADIAQAVRDGVVSAQAVVDAALARIERIDRSVNAFTAIASDRARKRALQIDGKRSAGAPLGELAGVPFAVKAMIDVAGITTTGGSALYRDAAPAAQDAAVVRRLEAAGAVCVGALNMDEFGMGGTTENACFGATRNPHDPTRTPGGSSGGCAAAVAAGLVPIAIGSDALGSVRLPASLCGVYGLRPTRGTIDDAGVLGSGGTLPTLGPLARSVADIALCHHAMRGAPDAPAAHPDLRIAAAGGYFRERLDADAHDALERALQALGVTRTVDFPEPRRARAASTLINAAESATTKLPLLRTRLAQFDPATRDRFLAHALLPAQWYLQAQRFRRRHNAAVRRLFEEVDVLIMPATPCVAPPIGTPTLRIDGIDFPTGPMLGWFTQPLAGTDCPALTVPIARPGRLPIGIQLFGPPGREAWLFDVASRLESTGVAAAPVACT